MEKLLQTLEAIIFAAGVPLKRSEILNSLPEEVSRKQLNDAIDKLRRNIAATAELFLKYSTIRFSLPLIVNTEKS